MTRIVCLCGALVVLSALLPLQIAHALVPWADSTLPVTSGLELWLDASRVREAAAANGVSLPSSGAVDTWYDSSGHRRDARQERKPLAPVLQSGESGLKFDGANDHLRVDIPLHAGLQPRGRSLRDGPGRRDVVPGRQPSR